MENNTEYGVSLQDIKRFLSLTIPKCNYPQNIPENIYTLSLTEILVLVPSIFYICNSTNPFFKDMLDNVNYKPIYNSINLYISTANYKKSQLKSKNFDIQELANFIQNIKHQVKKRYVFEITEIIKSFLETNRSIKSKPSVKHSVSKKSIIPLRGGKKRKTQKRKSK